MSKIADAIGHEALALLSAAMGGRIVCVPSIPNNASKLASRVGPVIASQLVEQFPDERLYVPKPAGQPQHHIDAETVRILTLRGHSADRIAADLGTTTRTIASRRSKLRLEGKL